MTKAPDIKTCPFCYSLQLEVQPRLESYMVVCCNPKCAAEGPLDEDRDTAIRKWNKALR